MPGLIYDRVIVPIDFSEESTTALLTAKELVGDLSGLHLVHVLFPLGVASPGVMWGDTDDEKRKTAVREHIGKLLESQNLSGVHTHIKIGNPGNQISDLANEINADLILIPSHGYHGVKRLLLGSVTERVLRLADCPVLVLRRKDRQ